VLELYTGFPYISVNGSVILIEEPGQDYYACLIMYHIHISRSRSCEE
jgi:hypothetical protein